MKSFGQLILLSSCMMLAFLVFDGAHALSTESSPSDITIDATATALSNTTTIIVKNPSGSDSQLSELDIYASDGVQIKAGGGPSYWALKITGNTAIFYTKDKPIIAGQQETFSVSTDMPPTSLAYDIYDSNENLLASDIIAVSTDYVPPPYVNNLYGFSISYPKGWFEQENADIGGYTSVVAFLAPSAQEFRPNMSIKTVDMQGSSFTDFVQAAKDSLAMVLAGSDYLLLNEGKDTVNGNPAYYIEYTISAGAQVELKTEFVEHGNTMFLVTCAAQMDQYKDNLRSFDNSISTLTITKDIHKDGSDKIDTET